MDKLILNIRDEEQVSELLCQLDWELLNINNITDVIQKISSPLILDMMLDILQVTNINYRNILSELQNHLDSVNNLEVKRVLINRI